MKKIALVFAFPLLIIFSSGLIIFSQIKDKQIQWTKIESPSGDLSFSVPSDYLIDNEDDQYRVIAFQDEATMRIEIEKSSESQNRVKTMRQYSNPAQKEFYQFTLGNFIGNFYKFGGEKIFSVAIYAASPGEYYSISVNSKNATNSTALNFLDSIRLGDHPIFEQATETKQEKNKVSISSLRTSPIVLEALNKKDAAKTKLKYELESKENSIDSKAFNDNSENSVKYSRPLIILRKPRVGYTDDARSNGTKGIVRIKVLFQSTGEIGDITVVKKLGNGLDRNAVDSVRKIKFLPAEIDGKPVDSFRMIEYSFSIY